MRKSNGISLKFDLWSVIALGITLISLLLSLNRSFSEIIISIGTFLIILIGYFAISVKKTIEEHEIEIIKLNEKLNIYKDISDNKSKIDLIMKRLKI